jgi:hypothetical protein
MAKRCERLHALVAVFAIGVVAPTFASGCDFVNTPTKVANGQLYTSGDGKYDPYFNQVHQEQVTAASWPDDSKAARKSIVVALNLRPGASNSTIFSAAREKKGDAALGSVIDETTSAERARSKKLTAASEKLDDLHKRGEDLKKQVIEERRNLAADKADEQKVKQKDELKREMTAAVEAVSTMMSDAKSGSKEADELARKLRGAWTGKDDEEAPPADPPKDEKKEEKPAAKPPLAKKPAGKPAAKPAAATQPTEKPADEKPAPKPAPAQKPADEVFNP